MANMSTGPNFTYGPMGYLPATLNPNFPVPDYPPDGGPSAFYKGTGLPDLRFWFPKDQIQNFRGRIPMGLAGPSLMSANTIPVALSTSIIAAAANVTSGTAMTLASANALGVAINIPIVPFSGVYNGAVAVTAPIVLDFGFAFGTGTAAAKAVTVADSTQFQVGDPLVISGAGNAGGTIPLLTWVTGITDATHITINDALAASITAQPIGSGNNWAPNEMVGTAYPTAHAPYMADGPALMLDPVQSLARCVSITGVSGGTGGNVLVAGWDQYWMPCSQIVAAGAGVSTVYSTKTFKAISSVTPQFTDAHNYSVGTGDVFGFAWRADTWESTEVCWNGASMTSSTGFLAPDTTAPATTATGNVRGTIQTGAAGAGSGIGSNASNGSLSGLALTGRRLMMEQSLSLYATRNASPFNAAPMFGVNQV